MPIKVRRATLLQFGRYILIGALVFVIDTGSFAFEIKHHAALFLATTLSYVLGVISHFTLNRLVNFRNFDRTWQEQARTYGAIVFCQYLLTLAIVTGGVALGLQPLAAKIVAIAANIPVGFLAHRYLTFGPGIIAVARGVLLRRGIITSHVTDDKAI